MRSSGMIVKIDFSVLSLYDVYRCYLLAAVNVFWFQGMHYIYIYL